MTTERIIVSKSFRDFLSRTFGTHQVSKLLLHAVDGDSRFADAVRRNMTDMGSYFTIRNDGNISYLPKGREHKVNDDGTWSRNGRDAIKPAKLIFQLFSPAAVRMMGGQLAIEKWTAAYKAATTVSDTIIISNDVEQFYNRDNVAEDAYSSCMMGDVDYICFYDDCPNVQAIGTRNTNGLFTSKALLWTATNGDKIIDRVYGAFKYQEFLTQYAKDKGMWIKAEHGAGEYTDFINPATSLIERKIWEIEVGQHGKTDQYPYIDTFTYRAADSSCITNSPAVLRDGSCGYKYQETDGGFYQNFHRCMDGRVLHESLCVWSQYHQDHIPTEDAICIDDDYFLSSECIYEDGYRLRSWIYTQDEIDEHACQIITAPNGWRRQA
jgi:hypothetical protein